MARSDNPRILARRLKVDKLRAEGVTQEEIAKKLKVTRRTIASDVAVLDEELQVEPQYSDNRKRLRSFFDEAYEAELRLLLNDMKIIRQGGSETTRSNKEPTDEMKKEAAKSAEGIIALTKGNLRQLEITEKVFGPNWPAIAMMHKAVLECLRDWAKLWALITDRVERETIHEREYERVTEREVVVLPKEHNEKEWQELAHKQAGGDVEIVVEPEVTPDEGRTPEDGEEA